MKIVNVTPGLIPIPPNGWGAVEKIIWEYHNNLQELGHESYIKYLNEVKPDEHDVVHIHVANLALEAHKRGIPYYFTMHDHHAYLHGKDSFVFKENHKAIKNSVLSFLPANYLVDYFGLDNAMYLPHGVNTKLFTVDDNVKPHSILCVANNGYAHDPTYDRKGFLPSIEVAKRLELPITICGPTKNNKLFFDKNQVNYDKLTIKYDLTEDELVEEYKKHTIFLHLSELEAGHPNLTLLEAMASGLVVVGTLEQDVEIGGFLKVNKPTNNDDIDVITSVVHFVTKDYQNIRKSSLNAIKRYDWNSIVKHLVIQYRYHKETIKKRFRETYQNTDKLVKSEVSIRELENRVNASFIQGPKVEVLGDIPKKYMVKFVDRNTGITHFETDINNNNWAKFSIEYYVDWDIIVSEHGGKTIKHEFNLEGQRVYVAIDSKAIGDTLAWVPMINEFGKLKKCNLIVSTFHNDLFVKQYPHIQFIKPGQAATNIYAMYALGLFYNKDNTYNKSKHPAKVISQPMQKMATDILGIDYKEIKPILPDYKVDYDDKLITIGIHGTTQAKYWNNPTGWQQVVDWLKNRGYTVKLISREPNGYMGNNHPTGVVVHPNGPLESAIKEIKRSRLFIGVGSGLSWISWAVSTQTVLISGFSYDWAEFKDCVRIAASEGSCAGCFNRVRLDAGDWNWCPDHKGTDRQFECTKLITGDMVIRELEKIL